MDPRQLPQCGKPYLVSEIVQGGREEFEGKSVRVTGKLTHYDCRNSVAILTDPRSKAGLTVATTLLEPFHACVGELVQFIGELDHSSESCDVILKARVVRSVNSLDLTLYQSALEQQRRYLENRRGDT